MILKKEQRWMKLKVNITEADSLNKKCTTTNKYNNNNDTNTLNLERQLKSL